MQYGMIVEYRARDRLRNLCVFLTKKTIFLLLLLVYWYIVMFFILRAYNPQIHLMAALFSLSLTQFEQGWGVLNSFGS